MKIVFVSQWFSEKMGYIENCLPFSVAKLGIEVHLVTSTAQVYFYQKHFKESYGTYLGEPIVNKGTYTLQGVTIHRLPFWHRKNIIYTRGLKKIISDIQPHIVHALDFESVDTLRLACYKNKLNLESEEEQTKSSPEHLAAYNSKCKNITKSAARKYRYDFELCIRGAKL